MHRKLVGLTGQLYTTKGVGVRVWAICPHPFGRKTAKNEQQLICQLADLAINIVVIIVEIVLDNYNVLCLIADIDNRTYNERKGQND